MTAEPAAPSRSLRRPPRVDVDRRARRTPTGGTDANETTEVLDTVRDTGEHVQAGARRLRDAEGRGSVLRDDPSMFGMMCNDKVPSEYRDWAETDHEPPGDGGRYVRVASRPSRAALDAALEARAIA